MEIQRTEKREKRDRGGENPTEKETQRIKTERRQERRKM